MLYHFTQVSGMSEWEIQVCLQHSFPISLSDPDALKVFNSGKKPTNLPAVVCVPPASFPQLLIRKSGLKSIMNELECFIAELVNFIESHKSVAGVDTSVDESKGRLLDQRIL